MGSKYEWEHPQKEGMVEPQDMKKLQTNSRIGWKFGWFFFIFPVGAVPKKSDSSLGLQRF